MTHRSHLSLRHRALALAAAALVPLAFAATAPAHATSPQATRAALAAERYYSSYGTPARCRRA
jgi:hypothetical protein